MKSPHMASHLYLQKTPLSIQSNKMKIAIGKMRENNIAIQFRFKIAIVLPSNALRALLNEVLLLVAFLIGTTSSFTQLHTLPNKDTSGAVTVGSPPAGSIIMHQRRSDIISIRCFHHSHLCKHFRQLVFFFHCHLIGLYNKVKCYAN